MHCPTNSHFEMTGSGYNVFAFYTHPLQGQDTHFLAWNVVNAVHLHITSAFRQSPLSGHSVLMRQFRSN